MNQLLRDTLLEIRWHARGGQGAVTMAEILADAALRHGLYSQAFPEYGPERSGAPLRAYNRIARKPIHLHSGVYTPDMVVVLDPTLVEAVPVAEGLKPDGMLLINTQEMAERIAPRIGFEGQIAPIPTTQLAAQVGLRFANVPMLGAVLHLIGLPLSVGSEALQEKFAKKLYPVLMQTNLEALRLGYEYVSSLTQVLDWGRAANF